MGYIRTNEDYYRSLGYSQAEAASAGVAADAGFEPDDGFCNPRKLQVAEELAKIVKPQIESQSDS